MKNKTNQQIVKDIMTNSKFGSLAEIFVMDAIDKLANSVANTKPSDYPKDSFIHPEAWIGLAQEIKEKLK
jgi:hypothetical protein